MPGAVFNIINGPGNPTITSVYVQCSRTNIGNIIPNNADTVTTVETSLDDVVPVCFDKSRDTGSGTVEMDMLEMEVILVSFHDSLHPHTQESETPRINFLSSFD